MKAIKVNIEKPCDEDWDQMQKTNENRRHCSVCRKNLVDFSIMSDADIVKWFDTHQKEETCGRWHRGQLNRRFIHPKYNSKKTIWNYSFSYLLLIFSLLNSKTSRANPISYLNKTEQTPPNENDTVKTKTEIRIKGHLKYLDNINASGILVKIADTDIETVTDSLGNFSFPFYDGLLIPSIKFIFIDQIGDETIMNIKDYNLSNLQMYTLNKYSTRGILLGRSFIQHDEIEQNERPLLERLWMKLNWW